MGEKMFDQSVDPTQERLAKRNETFDTPLIDNKTNRRVYRRLDVFQTLLRDGKIEPAHNSAAQKFLAHFQGRQRLDVRVVTDFTFVNQSLDLLMPPWQYHAIEMAETKEHLLPDEFQGLTLIADYETNPNAATEGKNPIIVIGHQLGGYRNRPCAYAWGLRLVTGALERLSYLYGYKTRERGKQ